ncbi:MAG: hypothetical protein M4579_006422, partial [Chaenotheca gracillima]
MYYVRFLKPPKVATSRSSNSKKLTSLVTITSDLGDVFFPARVEVEAYVRPAGQHGAPYLQQTSIWETGMRSLPFEFDLTSLYMGQALEVEIRAVGSDANDVHACSRTAAPYIGPPILSAWSIPFTPALHSAAPREVERRFQLSSGSILSIAEETGESIARHVWDAGVILLDSLSRQTGDLPSLQHMIESHADKLKVIELGSGCGIVGLGLAQTLPHCSVLLTDLPEAEDIVGSNMARLDAAQASSVEFAVLDWDAAIPPAIGQTIFDLIVVSDCTYNPGSLVALVRTLTALV